MGTSRMIGVLGVTVPVPQECMPAENEPIAVIMPMDDESIPIVTINGNQFKECREGMVPPCDRAWVRGTDGRIWVACQKTFLEGEVQFMSPSFEVTDGD